jgi:hypothetical protein
MKKDIAGILLLAMVLLVPGVYPDRCGAQTQAAQNDPAAITVEKITLMPFLTGKLESPNQPIAKPLSTPFSQIRVENQGLKEGADLMLTRIVNDNLKKRFQERMISPAQVAETYRGVFADAALETPRKRAVRLGEALGADVVMVGTVWRYREKGALTDVPDSPASVGFALYLIDVKTGARLWRGNFDGTQKALTEDILGGLKGVGMGLRWLSAEELAGYGVKSVLRKVPLK